MCYRVVTKLFGPNREEATGDWRKLRNEGLRDLYL
jgi:hypothetical protein